jgi:hypothetical protein
MPRTRPMQVARRVYPIAFRLALLCLILAFGLHVAGVAFAKLFAVGGLLVFMIAVMLAGIATSQPE